MAKAKKNQSTVSLELLDGVAFAAAVWFTYSVIDNARVLIEQNIKNAPVSYALILSIVLLCTSSYKRNKLSVLAIITLTVLATSVAIWLFGLSAPTSLY